MQVNEKKCGFGHFYYAIDPTKPKVLEIWKDLGEKHKKFHAYGKQIIDALFDADYSKAEDIYRDAKQYSEILISDLERVKKLCISASD